MNEIEMLDYIWNRFHAHLLSEVEKTSQSDVAKRLDVGKAQMSRWISESQKGGNLNTIIKAVSRLNMNWEDLVPSNSSTSEFDSVVGGILSGVAEGLHLGAKELQVEVGNSLSSVRISKIFQGQVHISAEELSLICGALGCSVDKILSRAVKMINEGKAESLAV